MSKEFASVGLKNLLIWSFFGFFLLPFITVQSIEGREQVSQMQSPQIMATIPVGLGGRDPVSIAVNPQTNRFYVAYPPTHSVGVFDGRTNQILASLNVHQNPREVVANPSTNQIYVVCTSDGGGIEVINGATNQVTSLIPIRGFTYGAAVNTVTNRIYVASNEGVTVLNGADYSIVGTIPMGGIRKIAVNSLTNQVYAIDSTFNKLIVIDGGTNSVTTSVGLGAQPFALRVNPKTNRIYVVNSTDKSISVVDGLTNTVAVTLPLTFFPGEIELDSDFNRIYLPSNQGVMVIDTNSNTILPLFTSEVKGETLAINQTTSQLYVASQTFDQVLVVNTTQGSIVDTILPGNPTSIDINPETKKVYVVTPNIGVSVIDGETNQITKNIWLNGLPRDIGVNPKTNRVYVTNSTTNTVSVIDGVTDTVVGTILIQDGPAQLAINPTTNTIYVDHFRNNGISVIDGATNQVTTTIDLVNYSPARLVCNPVTNRIYAAPISPNIISVIDGLSHKVIGMVIASPSSAGLLTVNQKTNQIYIVGEGIEVVDEATNTVVDTIPTYNVGIGSFAVLPDLNRIYATQATTGESSMHVIGIDSKTLLSTLPIGTNPGELAVNPRTNRIYVTNRDSDTIMVFAESDLVKPVVSDVILSKKKIIRKKDASVTISWRSSDNTGLVSHSITCATDGENFGTPVVSGLPGDAKSFEWTVASSFPKTKKGVIQVVATDQVGNEGMARSNTFVVK